MSSGILKREHIAVKDRNLIGKLITSVVVANGGSITKQELEGYLDDEVVNGLLRIHFHGQTLIWKEHEDNIAEHKERFHSVVEKISDLDHNSLRVEFDIRCETCGSDLVKLDSDPKNHKFKCKTCMVTHTFTITTSAEVDTTGDDSVTVF